MPRLAKWALLPGTKDQKVSKPLLVCALFLNERVKWSVLIHSPTTLTMSQLTKELSLLLCARLSILCTPAQSPILCTPAVPPLSPWKTQHFLSSFPCQPCSYQLKRHHFSPNCLQHPCRSFGDAWLFMLDVRKVKGYRWYFISQTEKKWAKNVIFQMSKSETSVLDHRFVVWVKELYFKTEF